MSDRPRRFVSIVREGGITRAVFTGGGCGFVERVFFDDTNGDFFHYSITCDYFEFVLLSNLSPLTATSMPEEASEQNKGFKNKMRIAYFLSYEFDASG
jgi:hypothetical protein